MPLYGLGQRSFMRGQAREPAPATFLPVVSSSPVIAFGLASLIPTYGGPLVNVVRASDSATSDIGTVWGGLDRTAALAFQGASTLYGTIGYDQSGSGNHLIENVQANRMRLFLGAGTAALISGRVSASTSNAEGNSTNVGGAFNLPRRFRIPSMPSLDRQAMSVFVVYRDVDMSPAHTLYPWEFGDTTGPTSGADDVSLHRNGTTYAPSVRYDTTTLQASIGGAGYAFGENMASSAGWTVMGLQSSASALATWCDGRKQPLSGPMTSKLLTLGGQAFCSHTANSVNVIDGAAFVVYPGTLTDAEMVAVSTALRTIFNANTTPAITITGWGDSQQEGIGVFDNLTLMRQLADLVGRRDIIYRNLGQGGTTAVANSTSSSGYPRTSADFATRWQYPGAVNVARFQHGGNDVFTGTTAATTYDAICTLGVAARARGISKVWYGIPLDASFSAANAFNGSSAKVTEMQNLRALILANGGRSSDGLGKADIISDYTSDTRLCTPGCVTACANTTYFFTDQLHANGTGIGLMAAIDRAALATAGVA